MHRRILVKVALGLGVLALGGAAAFAAPPGPGDKQCVPGHQGNPHPGFKAGVCPNP
jgi:hypothetical protein